MKNLTTAILALYVTLQNMYGRAKARLEVRPERGSELVGWIILVIAVIAIAGLVTLAVRAYVTQKTGELGN